MSVLRFTLVADGARDRCLMPVISWVLEQIEPVATGGFTGAFADFREMREPPSGLQPRIEEALRQLPCDLLFVHRDSEGQDPSLRRQEIAGALHGAGTPRHVPIVPIRMTEAWLLADERAIRTAANNPNGVSALPIPAIHEVEALPNPKEVLNDCLMAAQDLGRRRRRQFQKRLGQAVYRVAELTESFGRLRALSAFSAFEQELRAVAPLAVQD